MEVLGVPLVEQHDDHTCGVAALLSLLEAFGERGDQSGLARALAADEATGVTCRALVREGARRGLQTEDVPDMTLERLAAELDAGYPVLLLLQAWGKDGTRYRSTHDWGHYVVAVGHEGGRFAFMDPSWASGYLRLDGNELLQRWHSRQLKRWGLILRRPGGAPGLARVEVDAAELAAMP